MQKPADIAGQPDHGNCGAVLQRAGGDLSTGDVQGTLSDYQSDHLLDRCRQPLDGGLYRTQWTGELHHLQLEPVRETRILPCQRRAHRSEQQRRAGDRLSNHYRCAAEYEPGDALDLDPDSVLRRSRLLPDQQPFATSSDFTASINWGDNTTPTLGTISSNGFNSFSVIGQHTYTTVGTLPITVTIVSPGGQTNTVVSTAIVSALPVSVFPTQVTGNAGQPLNGVTVATFLDPYTTDTPNDFRATVDWGDGTVNVGTITSQGNGVFSVTGDHTYTASGTYTINIQVVRIANGQTASTSSAAQIGSPSPTFAFTGGLAPVPANGPFISSGYATTNQPTFDGTAAAYAIVQLFARPANLDVELPLGETVADTNGRWSLATGPLAAGGYLVTAKVTPPAGYPSEMMALTSNHGTFFINMSPPRAPRPQALRQRLSRPRQAATSDGRKLAM